MLSDHLSSPSLLPDHTYSPPCVPLSASAKRGKGEDFKKIDYKEIKKHTQEQRAKQIDPEKLLWEELRGRKLDNKLNIIQWSPPSLRQQRRGSGG